MNRNDIITLPHASLHQRSVRVGFITDEIIRLIEHMKQATIDWEAHRKHEVGVALAAVQVNKLYRIVIVREDFNDKTNTHFQVFINPEIVKFEGELVEDYEGCLSVQDVYGKVPRYSKVRVKAKDENGRILRVKAEGFLARVFQHEIDHTNGILFVDHIKKYPERFFQLNDVGKITEMTDAQREHIFRILW